MHTESRIPTSVPSPHPKVWAWGQALFVHAPGFRYGLIETEVAGGYVSWKDGTLLDVESIRRHKAGVGAEALQEQPRPDFEIDGQTLRDAHAYCRYVGRFVLDASGLIYNPKGTSILRACRGSAQVPYPSLYHRVQYQTGLDRRCSARTGLPTFPIRSSTGRLGNRPIPKRQYHRGQGQGRRGPGCDRSHRVVEPHCIVSGRDQCPTQTCTACFLSKEQESKRGLAHHAAVVLQYSHARGYLCVRVCGRLCGFVFGGVDQREAADCYRTRDIVVKMHKTRHWKDVKLLSSDLQQVVFQYFQDYTLSIRWRPAPAQNELSANVQTDSGSYELSFSCLNQATPWNPHSDLESHFTRRLQDDLAAGDITSFAVLLRDSLPVLLEINRIAIHTSINARLDVFYKAVGWYRVLIDSRYGLDFRLLSRRRLAILDATQSLDRPVLAPIPLIEGIVKRLVPECQLISLSRGALVSFDEDGAKLQGVGVKFVERVIRVLSMGEAGLS
ncbi:hypothetical protein AG1IA_03372 [Rhizoctonia solani AG-1 IA]|uniref:Uncharacterized protein n=1 Tax=Thanatephorus cucumeris (strain AG1-IA) TaxID=983506 RepID=L8WX82_THACA|nr:hypothetical protein AG1IA_03372 [Rhizoctonia solani AG-1 IA]